MSVKVIVDRKMGTYHPEHPDLYYPINYGYIPDVMGGDGEEIQVHSLEEVDEALDQFGDFFEESDFRYIMVGTL